MKTQKHYKRHYKQTKKNKIKKQNVTRKNMKRGGIRRTTAQLAAANEVRTVNMAKDAAKREIKNAKAREKKNPPIIPPATKPIVIDFAEKPVVIDVAAKPAVTVAKKMAVTVAVDDEIIPIIQENAIKEANKQAPYVNPEKIVKNVLDFTSIIAESAKKAANSTLGVVVKNNKFKANPKQEPPPEEEIKVHDFIIGEDISPSQFFLENKDDEPYILVSMIENNQKKKYSANRIGRSKGNKEFVECKDDTPVGWQGNAYERYIKPGGRRFIKAFLGGAPIMLLKPSWFDSGKVPGDKFFTVVSAEPVFKLMSLKLANGIDGNFDARGANHCNQIGTQITYALEGEQQNTGQEQLPPAELNTTTGTNPPAQPNTKGTKPVTKPIIVTKPGTKPIIITEPGTKPIIVTKPGTKPIIVTKPGTKPIKITDPASATSEDVTIAQSIEDEEERQRLEDEETERQRQENEETEKLRQENEETEKLRQENEETEKLRQENKKTEAAAMALSLAQEPKASSPKENKKSSKKAPSARPPSPEYRYSSSSYKKPNSYALLAAPRYKNYFSDASDKPNSYALLNSRRRLSGGGKSRHTSSTSKKQRIK
jgi:hypothetical protein